MPFNYDKLVELLAAVDTMNSHLESMNGKLDALNIKLAGGLPAELSVDGRLKTAGL